MSSVNLVVESNIDWTTRTQQVASMFDLSHQISQESWTFDFSLPKTWAVGLIVGPSGSGKSTIGRHLFSDGFSSQEPWPTKGTIIDGFPSSIGVKEICAALSSVGFSSPPSWLRPYHVLSTGQQFRSMVARELVRNKPRIVIDEWTSVVDRTVAKIGSAAIGKAIRRKKRQLVAIGCHYDVIEWLQPDWVLHMPDGKLERRHLQSRPTINLDIRRVSIEAWNVFRQHHYLNHSILKSAACFLVSWKDRPVAFISTIFFPHATRPGFREHRTVCLPDFQGVGIGNRVSELIASAFICRNKPYRSVTSHPAMIRYRAKSPLWKMTRSPSRVGPQGRTSTIITKGLVSSRNRLTASFEYVGTKNLDVAKFLGII